MIAGWRIVAAAVLLLGAYGWGRMDGAAPVKAQLERERAQWAQGQAAALAAEIKRSATIMDELRANHAQATERAARAESEALAASAAAAAAHTMARRVRDASATDLLAARAAIESAGATRQCAPAIQAAELRERVLGELDGLAGRIGSAAVEVARHADQAYGAASECAAAYDAVTR